MMNDLSLKEINRFFKTFWKQADTTLTKIEGRKKMTIKELYATSKILADIDENLANKEKSYENEIKETQDYLNDQRINAKNNEQYTDEETFRMSYDWKFDRIDNLCDLLAAVRNIRKELIKLAK